jgi:hypothetical protein
MKKSIGFLMAGVLLAALAVQAESLTIQGVVFSENNGKYWRVGKITADGKKVVKAILPAEEAAKISPMDGKEVTVTGEKDTTWTGNVPKFKQGFTVEEIK